MDLKTALNKLYSLHLFGIKLGLENIQEFLEFIGNPQNELKAFHIAGSNGKGSTASFIASILMEFGYKVGLYTSPHFVRFNERIKINNHEIPDDYLSEFVTKYENYIDEHKLTFFEVTTAIAFKYFYEEKVDFAVIETGLGGRLDATNVLSPLGVIITSISLEHTDVLGDTISKIAKEKAGIIKHHTNVFTGKIPNEAENVIEEQIKVTESKLYKLRDYILERGNSIELYTEELELDDWNMPLRGKYQKYNAAISALAVSKVLLSDDFKTIERGIHNVVKNTGLQGRFEYLSKEPDIILDSAHNPEGIENFLEEFRKGAQKYSKKTLLFGVMRDKAIKEMLLKLQPNFDEILITDLNYERSCKVEELKKIADEFNIKVTAERNHIDCIKGFAAGAKNNCLVVLGSMYLVGDIKSSLKLKDYA
jgi:dihydrofolate synthase / folylpolyglutamate synthase